MKTLYLDLGMGAAGDMLTAALAELLPDKEAFVQKLNALAIPGIEYRLEDSVKCGITGSHMTVLVHGEEEGEYDHAHDHDHPHDHEHHHDHNHEDHHDHDHEDDHDYEHEHDHHHDHEHEHDHHHDHEHEHHHDHDHEHPHDHEHHHHHHSSLHDISHIVEDLPVSEKVRADVLAVYRLIAEAESSVHGVPVDEIHFHEVGTMDAVADVTAVCLAMAEISPDEVVASPVHVGIGHVHCAHGILPVPAPATAHILQGIPMYGGEIRGELCTPTGAALLKHFVTRFGDMPAMKTEAIGYGMGKKDFPRANCVRALLGETEDRTDVVLELSCNMDDMTAEAISYASEQLFKAGAFEVYTIPIGMKKSRPGTLLRVMTDEENRDNIVRTMFKYTTTIGIRETVTHRFILDRSMVTVNTPYGPVRCKISSGYGVKRHKFEFDDLAKLAAESGKTLDEIRQAAEEALKAE